MSLLRRPVMSGGTVSWSWSLAPLSEHFTSLGLSSCSAGTLFTTDLSLFHPTSGLASSPLNISPPQGWTPLQPSIWGLGPKELLKEIFLGWEGGRVSRVSRVEFLHPCPPGLDMVRVARAGDEIKVGTPKKRQNLAEDCPRTLHSCDWLHGGGGDTSPLSNLGGPCLGGWETVRGHF